MSPSLARMPSLKHKRRALDYLNPVVWLHTHSTLTILAALQTNYFVISEKGSIS